MTAGLTVVDSTVLFVAALLAVAPALRHIPKWAIYLVDAGVALYALFRVLRDGPGIENVGFTVLFAALALHVWWRDLRGKQP